jgi:YVTN family beta-propeller protein
VVNSGHALPMGTVTMLFTDVEGSTRLLKRLGEGYGELLSDHRRLLREAFAAHGGREMDTQGDAFFVAFARARNAVEAAVEAQRALAGHTWPDGVECRVRMALHTGEPSVGDEGYHGIGLHRGARIAAAAHGGQILLSSTTAELIQDDLPAGVALRDLGVQQLKDIDRPERIFQVVAQGLASAFPPPRAAGEPEQAAARSRRPVLLGGALAVLVTVAAAVVFLATRGGAAPANAAGVAADSVGIFRPGNGRLTGQIDVGSSPGAVVFGAGSIWVANVDDHSVSRIDPVRQVVIQEIQVGNGPAGIAYGDGFVWVTNGLDGTVMKIDPRTNTFVQTIPVGNAPEGIAVDKHAVWVANSTDRTVSRIDRATGKPLGAPVSVGAGADGIAVGAGAVWVTSQSTGTVTRIDLHSGSVVQPIHAGNGAAAVTVGAKSVWVANNLDGNVTRIDPVSNAVLATIPVGDGPNGIAVTPGAVWVSNELAGTLSKIDPIRNTVVQVVETGNRPEGVVLGAGALFVAVRTSGAGHRGGTLTVLKSAGGLSSFDPAVSSTDWQMFAFTNDGLTGFRRVGGSAGTRLVPDLAASLPTPTDRGRSYTFQLRPGLRYSTGALVRPQDFRRALERSLVKTDPVVRNYYSRTVGAQRCLAAPKMPCDLSQGITTDPAANTVTFQLTAPDPDFLIKLALPPAYAVPDGTPLHLRHPLPATGPYRIASYDPKHAVRLVRNPRFREWSRAAQPSGFPDSIVERVGGSADAHTAAVVHGSADLASDAARPSPAALASVRTQHASRLEVNPWTSTYFLVLNTRIAPFDDVRVRQALNFAVDRERLRDMVVGPGLGQVTCQIVPPNFDGYQRYCPYTAEPTPAGTWNAPDLARAQRLVRASGTAGQTVTVWIPYWAGVGAAAGKYVVSVLDSLGYNAHFRLASKQHDPYFTEDKHHLQIGFFGWLPDYTAASQYFVPTLTCGSYDRVNSHNSNTAEFCDHSIDREIARAQFLQTSDPEAASRLWGKIDHDVTDQAPWVPYANGVVLEVISARVGNYQYNPLVGTLLDQLWVR